MKQLNSMWIIAILILILGCSKDNPAGPEGETSFWQNSSSGLPENTTVQAITSSSDGTVVYIGTYSGVYRSQDSGNTWVQTNTGLESGDISCLAVAPESDLVYVGSWGKGVFKSTNGGDSWTSVWSSEKNPHINAVHIASDYTVWVATEHGLFRSKNDGLTWEHVFEYGKVRTVAVAPAKTQTIYLGVRWHGNFRSDDGGETWQEINTGVYTDGQEFAAANDVVFDPQNPQHIIMSTGWIDLYESFDGGDSWQRVADNLREKSVLALDIAHTFQEIWAATDSDGVFVSRDNSNNWIAKNSGIENVKVKSLSVAKEGAVVFVGTLGKGVYKYVVKK